MNWISLQSEYIMIMQQLAIFIMYFVGTKMKCFQWDDSLSGGIV